MNAQGTVATHRTKVVGNANQAFELARDGMKDGADRLADLTGHERIIHRANDITRLIDALRTDMAAIELQEQIEMEEVRRAAHAAAQEPSAKDSLERLDDPASDYVDSEDDR